MKKRPLFLLPACVIVTTTAARSAIITSTFTGATSQSYSAATNWSPTGVPANNATDQFQVVIPPSLASPVLFDLGATVNSLGIGVNSTLSIQNSISLTAAGDVANNGLILLNGASNTRFLVSDPVDQSITLGGTGALRLTNAGQNISGSISNNQVLTQGPSHTIEGTGFIGAIGIDLVNQGTILANVSGEKLTINPFNTFHNNGLVRAENGGIGAVSRGVVTQGAGGRFEVADGSRFDFQTCTFSGVTLSVDDQDNDLSNNLYQLSDGGTIFKNVLLTGSLTTNGRALTLAGDLTNNGIIRTVGGFASRIVISDPDDQQVLLGGTGRVIMNDTEQAITGSLSHILTQGPSHTIEGTGFIGTVSINVVNQGTILANAATPLRFLHLTSFENQGTIRVASGSTIAVNRPGFTNNGLIDVRPGGSFLFDSGLPFSQSAGELKVSGVFSSAGLTVTGGVVSGAGRINGSFINITGTVKPGDPFGTLDLRSTSGNSTINGPVEIELQSDSDHDNIDFDNKGQGTITLSLKVVGPASGFSGAPIKILSNIQSPVNSAVRILISNVGFNGGRLATTDGRASFLVNGSGNGFEYTLTDPLFAPEFAAEPYAFSVDESAVIGTTVGFINAVDPEGSGVTYSIIGSTPFAIGAANGVITLNGPLDFSTQPIYTVQVGASDGSLTAITPVTITINPLPGSNEAVVHDLLTGVGGAFAGQTDPAVVGFDADPDGDDIANVFELWLGSDPAVADGPADLVVFPLTVGPDPFAALDVTVVKSVDDVLVVNGQLSHGLQIFRNGVRSELSDTVTTRRLRFLDSVAIPDVKAFGRLAADPDAVK